MTEKAGNESMNHYQKLTACSAQTVSFVASFACSVSLGKKKKRYSGLGSAVGPKRS